MNFIDYVFGSVYVFDLIDDGGKKKGVIMIKSISAFRALRKALNSCDRDETVVFKAKL